MSNVRDSIVTDIDHDLYILRDKLKQEDDNDYIAFMRGK